MSFLIASTHTATNRANVSFLIVCICFGPLPGREKDGSGAIRGLSCGEMTSVCVG